MDETNAPDTAMATGNDAGTPGEQSAQEPADSARRDILSAVAEEAPLHVRVEDAPNPDTPVFREPS